tara:strand:- start:56 stop:628 length:573 start_codon:yes stop_codon:yes gene_type:complete
MKLIEDILILVLEAFFLNPVVFIIVAMFVWFFVKGLFSPKRGYPKLTEFSHNYKYNYAKKNKMVTENEYRFFCALRKALGHSSEFHIQVQTPLLALLDSNDEGIRQIWAKRVDFVISNRFLEPLLIIELDDSSHYAADRRQRDAFVESILANKHRLVRFQSEKYYCSEKIKNRIQSESGLLMGTKVFAYA